MTEIKPGTPLPWVVHPEMAWVTSANAPDDAPVCELCVESYGDNREPEAEANARYIVTACNAYPSLLNGLREAKEALDATPLRGRNEDPRAFDDRQTAWLRDFMRPVVAKLDTLLSQEGQP